MVSVEDALSHARALSLSHSKLSRSIGRSMRTHRSTVFTAGSNDSSRSTPNVSQNLTTDSLIDFKLNQLSAKGKDDGSPTSNTLAAAAEIDEILEASRTFSDFSACSSDISGELQLLASLPGPGKDEDDGSVPEPNSEPEPCSGFLERESFSTEIIESISPEDLQPTVKLCVDCLQSPSMAMKRSAAAKLRLLAKNRADNRVLICDSGAVPALIPLARCPDPLTQEHAVTALLNLSLHDQTRRVIARAPDSVKSLIYALRTGSEASKQNAACALLSLSLLEDYKLSIGASGAIPPLVQLLIGGTNRGKKDALTTLYKLCSAKLNKERAVNAGVVRALVGLVEAGEVGLAEKAMVVMSSLATVEIGRETIVEEGGMAALVEVVEDGRSVKGKEFAVMTLLEMCRESLACRGVLVREGGIPPLVALSQNGTPKAKHKAEALLAYLRESRQEASSSSSPPMEKV